MDAANTEHTSQATTEIDEIARNTAEIVGEVGKAVATYVRTVEEGRTDTLLSERAADIVKTFGTVAEHWLKDPARAVEAQSKFATTMIDLWSQTLRQLHGEPAKPVAEPDPRDKRFTDKDWTENPYFNFIKQAYLVSTQWADTMVSDAEGLDPHTRQKASFYVRQIAGALAPSNFLATNPELLRTTIEQKGANLVRGLSMLNEDLDAGDGELKIRQTDPETFAVGTNLATTPGKVIFRNDLMELIQYSPTTDTVFARPILIVPPWINKFYVLDLTAEKSFIRWMVAQGLTVFVVSWINPDARHRACGWEAYMREGPLAALDVVEKITGRTGVHMIGYCVGGTLVGVTLSYLAATRAAKRVERVTFLTTQVDFTHAGELLTFVDEGQIRAVEEVMSKMGYLPSIKMAGAFNMLRPNDLIWSYFVNNYMRGKKPPPFDLLYWNSDSTRMTEANHSYYLRNFYLDNKLAKGIMKFCGTLLSLHKVKTPIYNLAAREDHIAPAKSVFEGSKLFGGPVTYVVAGSGHIAGVVNPATRPKYQFWTGGPCAGTYEDWIAKAEETAGSWWPHWLEWTTKGDKKVPARVPGEGRFPALCDAPGTYVRER